jgi:hypothetical protein
VQREQERPWIGSFSRKFFLNDLAQDVKFYVFGIPITLPEIGCLNSLRDDEKIRISLFGESLVRGVDVFILVSSSEQFEAL